VRISCSCITTYVPYPVLKSTEHICIRDRTAIAVSALSSSLVRSPKHVGGKLSCGGIVEIARIRAQFRPTQFCALAEQSDWLVPALAVGATGTITDAAKLFPNGSSLRVVSTARNRLLQSLEDIRWRARTADDPIPSSWMRRSRLECWIL
jgi:hypothetical protein